MSGENYNPKSFDATLSRIETKLDSALASVKQHDERIAVIERRIWLAFGGFSLLTISIPIGLHFVK